MLLMVYLGECAALLEGETNDNGLINIVHFMKYLYLHEMLEEFGFAIPKHNLKAWLEKLCTRNWNSLKYYFCFVFDS